MNRAPRFTAEQPAAADALQRALRSRFRQRLMPGVRHTTITVDIDREQT